MRLINADKLRADVLSWENCYNGFSDTYDKARIIDAIDEQPTIEAEPVRRGRWVLKDNPYTGWYTIACSECGEDVTSTAPCFGGVVTWDFCPWCGARMEVQK